MSRPRLRLNLTDDQEHELWQALETTRRKTATVRVSRDAFERLLMDFGRALARVPEGYETADGKIGP